MDTTITLAGGYTVLSAGSLYKALEALSTKSITYLDFRAFFACTELLAIRNSAYRKEVVSKTKRFCYFKFDELQKLLGGGVSLQRSLNRLNAANLLTFASRSIIIHTTLSESLEKAFKEQFKRSPNRRIPVPRRVLTYISKCSKPALSRAIVAYLLQGLCFQRGGGINNKGAVKSSWIATIAGISLRSAQSARAALIKLGLLSKDTQSTQRKLNRTGAYFEINASWEAPSQEKTPAPGAEFAYPPELPTTEFAYPYKDIKSSNETNKTQKLKSPGSGVSTKLCSGTPEKPANLPPPRIQAVIIDDLKRLGRLETLYKQALSRRLISKSQADKLNFVAAAVRAANLSNKGNPIKIFMGLLRKKLWQNISQAEEDKARRWVLKYYETLFDFGDSGAKSRTPLGFFNSVSCQA
jgi:hypothetical protein